MLKSIEWTETAGAPIQATLIQAGIPQDQKWLPEQREPTMNFYRDATLSAMDSALIVWPEVAIPSLANRVEDYIDSLDRISDLTGQTILFGILETEVQRTGETNIYNSVILVNGQQRQVYRKRHLVPFGEYFPVPANVREWMRLMNLPFSDLSPGEDEQALLVAADGTRLAVAICYEDAFGAEMGYAFPEATLLINVSNDAWFGDSIAPHQHLQIARMRSLEFGRFSIRATNTGISAFIDARGKVLRSGAQFKPLTMTMKVEPRTGTTPYTSSGNWPVIGLCFLIIAGFWLRSRAA
jgi:apolipoprotein N-acyltransferase